MLQAWLNGAFVPMDQAKVSAFDAGFQHGVGLFETMAARHGRVFRVMDHMARLRDSAMRLGLADRLRIDALADAAELAVERNGMRDARVRLTLTAGDMNMLARGAAAGGAAADAAHDPTILIQVQPPTPYPPAIFEQGVGVRVADAQLNVADPFAGHKTLWYWPRLAALQQAAGMGLHEALWFDVTRGLGCGCVSNVFVVKGGVLHTPLARGEEPSDSGLRSPVLPGITRAAVIALAGDAGIEVSRERIEVQALLGADEVFLVNSSWHVLPVVRIEQRTIGTGAPGPVTARLRAALLECVDRECREAAPGAGG
jgi:branched-subunit amino acid aminotransferase/4-amino-4-deoxychorismate lyase